MEYDDGRIHDDGGALGMDLMEGWVRDHHPAVCRAARMVLRDGDAAEDVAQEAFVRAARSRTNVEDIEDPRAWLCRIGINLAISRLRSTRRERAALERVVDSTISGTERDPFDDSTEGLALAGAIGRLPDALRVPIVLRYYADLPEIEIARLLSIRRGTVKSRLHRARQVLAGDAAVVAVGHGS